MSARVSCRKIGLLLSRSQRRLKLSVNVYRDGIFWTTEHFVTKLGTVMQYYEPECCAEKLVHCLQCQGHSEGLNTSKILLCPLYLLNCRSVCYQTWFGSIASKAGVSCGKIGLLCSRTRLQRRFKMSVSVRMISSELQNVLSPNLVWWCSIMSQSVMLNKIVCYFQGQGHSRIHLIKIWLFLLYFLSCWFFGYQTRSS